MFIIGLGHRRRVGKDTFAHILIDKLNKMGIVTEQISFSTPMYQIAEIVYGWAGFKTKEFYDNDEVAKASILPALGKTPRDILIAIGKIFREDIHNDTWIHCALTTPRNCTIGIISDVRFPNEFKLIQECGGKCVKIIRPSYPEFDDPCDSALSKQEGWDYIIENDGTLEDLNKKADEFIDMILKSDINLGV